MRGLTSVPFVALLATLAILIMFSARAAAEDIGDPNDPYDDTVLYTPQAAPADQALDPSAEELYPVAPAPEVAFKSAARRASRPGTISSRRVTVALTLLLAARLNTPQFRASLGSIPQSGAALGLLPGVAVANATRIQGIVPVRRDLAARRVPPSRPSTQESRVIARAVPPLQEGSFLH